MATGPIQRVRSVLTGVGGAPRYSNLYFQGPDIPDSDYQDAVVAMWNAVLLRVYHGITITVEGTVTVLDSATGNVLAVGGFANQTLTTTGSGDALPLATCGLARFHTGVFLGSREVRGRMFLPYPPAGDSAAAMPDSSYIADWNGAFVTMNAEENANGAWCVWSRKNGQNELVSEHDIWDNWAVLRSQRD